MNRRNPSPRDRDLTKSRSGRLQRRLRRLVPGAGGADGGYVLIMTGLLLIPLLAFTAFAVDVGSWYAQGVKMQRAADAAALAGVVWAAGSAGSCPSQTYNCVAIDTAARDGYTITNADVTKISDSKISVTINATASMYFGSLFLKNQTLARTATAAYTTPVPMGSPSNQMGNDPDNNNLPQFWNNLSGAQLAQRQRRPVHLWTVRHGREQLSGEHEPRLFAERGVRRLLLQGGGGIGCIGPATAHLRLRPRVRAERRPLRHEHALRRHLHRHSLRHEQVDAEQGDGG